MAKSSVFESTSMVLCKASGGATRFLAVRSTFVAGADPVGQCKRACQIVHHLCSSYMLATLQKCLMFVRRLFQLASDDAAFQVA